MKTTRSYTLIFTSLLLLVCLPAAARASHVEGVVQDAADGATLLVSTRDNTAARFRLRALKVPPVASAFGSLARKHLSDLTKGKKILLKVTSLDRDGTLVGPVFDGGADIAMQMLRDGAAHLDTADQAWQDEYSRRLYADCEAAARSEGRGVWEKGVLEEVARSEAAAAAPAGPQPAAAAAATGEQLKWVEPAARPAARRKRAPLTAEQKAAGGNGVVYSLLLQGHYAAALPLAREAVRQRPADAEAHKNLAVALGNTAAIDEAFKHAREAVRLDPRLYEGRDVLGSALYFKGRHDEAVREFKEAVRLNPLYARAHYNLGVTLMLLGRDGEALTAYRAAERLAPDQPVVKVNTGVVLYRLGRREEARAKWREVLAMGDPFSSRMARQNLEKLP